MKKKHQLERSEYFIHLQPSSCDIHGGGENGILRGSNSCTEFVSMFRNSLHLILCIVLLCFSFNANYIFASKLLSLSNLLQTSSTSFPVDHSTMLAFRSRSVASLSRQPSFFNFFQREYCFLGKT